MKIKDVRRGRLRKMTEFGLHKLTGSPVQGSLLDGWEYYQQLARTYKPLRYTGSVNLILQKSEKSLPGSEWRDFADTINVHWISQAPDHDSIFKEPYVREVASKITSLLQDQSQ